MYLIFTLTFMRFPKYYESIIWLAVRTRELHCIFMYTSVSQSGRYRPLGVFLVGHGAKNRNE